MTASMVMEAVRTYVQENFLYARPDFELTDNQALIGAGIVDSMGIMELIAFIDERFGVVVADEDITEANLGTLASITDYVASRVANPTGALAEAV